MADRALQLVLQYDGARFAGWQRQPGQRTVQGVLEESLARIVGQRVPVIGAGRTDAGVHALAQAAGVSLTDRWSPNVIRRALNGVLPQDLWVSDAFDMHTDFHARYSATARRYRYLLATGEDAASPFRRLREWAVGRPLDFERLAAGADAVRGDHCFRGFAVRGTAPERDQHRCVVTHAMWRERDGGLVFEIEANRFLHHMVRFLVGTMVEIALGRRDPDVIPELLQAADNRRVSPPAPPWALYLTRVSYPPTLYL